MESGGGGGAAALRRWSTSGSGSQYSFRTSVSISAADDISSEIEELEAEAEAEAGPPPVEDKVFVAVAEDAKHGKSAVLWAVQNLAKDGGAKVVVAHVHCPAQMIPMMGANVHYTKMNPQQVKDHRKKEREKAEEKLHEYVVMCGRLKVSCEKIIIEKDDVAKGLEELITLHGITMLVMGAAADKHYSKKMKTPKSKTALKLMETAASSCTIWFTCKQHLICTRQASTTVPAIPPPSPAHTVASTLSAASSSISSHTRSMTMMIRSGSEASSSSGSPTMHDLNRSRTQVITRAGDAADTPSRQQFEPLELSGNGNARPPRTPVNSVDSWDDFGRRSQHSWDGSSRNDDDAASVSGGPATRHQIRESDDDHFSSPSRELLEISPSVDADMYGRLEEALREAQGSKKEAFEESSRRRKAERELISTLQKAKELENLYHHEARQRRAMEETVARQAQEAEEEKRQRDTIYQELRDAEEQNRALERLVAEMQADLAFVKEKLADSIRLVEALRDGEEKMRQEREAAVAEADELHRKSQQRLVACPPAAAEALSTEFSPSELERATRGFDAALKIGEGGFGSVYKGSLRNTTVAIKLLHPQSMQGQSEFYQEVAVLSRVRHPNLVTLIGACREAFGLVYEYLPNGSLEDRLACAGSTPPLPWQLRTRIIGEMCSALTFLHSNKPHPVVHGDLKPANILLDGSFVSKLGDFGICRLLSQSSNTTAATTLYRTTTPKGTFAYMDPEFLLTGELTPRSDVYSFGIIILRLLTGRPSQKIAEVVEDAMEKGQLHAVLDPSAGSWPFVQANQLAHLGLRCAEMTRRRRPDVAGEVWKVIEPLTRAASLTAGRPPSFAAWSVDDASPPSYFICPIFQEVMSDPHMAADGFTYEAEAIRGWLDSGHDTSPMTNLKLAHCELTPNRGLRSAILEWQQQQQQQEDEEDEEDWR